MIRTLSSRSTALNKYVLPAFFCPTWVMLALNASPHQTLGWFPLLFWTVACGFIVWWTLPLKKVHLAGETFRISNYFREIEVPAVWLQRVVENNFGRSRNIALFFEPATAFGGKITIIPPMDFSGTEKFEAVAQILREIVATNRGPEPAPPEKSAEFDAILADPTPDKMAAVATLADSELDELIDQLSYNSELRDFARKVRRKRWYG